VLTRNMVGVKTNFHDLKGVSPPHVTTLVYILLTAVIGIPATLHKV